MNESLYSPAAEEALIGAILINSEVIREINLTAEEIYTERNRWIFMAAQDLRMTGKDIDPITVCAKLSEQNRLEACGGLARVTDLVNACSSSLNAQSYADIIRDRARRRELLNTANKIANLAQNLDSDLVNGIPEQIDALSRNTLQSSGAVHISQYLGDLYDQVGAANANPREIYGIPTGMSHFDKIAGGLIPREIIKITGDPGIGKSLWAVQLCCGAAAGGAPGAIFELEMSGISVVRRRVSVIAKVSTRSLRTGKMSDQDLSAFNQALAAMEKLPIWMSDQSQINSLAMRVDLERLKSLYGIQWFLLDYEGLLTDDGENEIARSKLISKRVHAIAKDLNLAGLVIDDMNKAGIGNSESGKANLSGSAGKIYDADQIIMMRYNPKDKKLINVTWEKMREDESDRFMELVRVPGFPAFTEAAL